MDIPVFSKITVQQRVSTLADRLLELRAHPMCVKLFDDGVRFVMEVPPGFTIDAVRCDYSVQGKSWALGKMIEISNRYWERK